ncbi:MAG: hypothetical protein ABMB14_06315 [Myxococcota bacterium]
MMYTMLGWLGVPAAADPTVLHVLPDGGPWFEQLQSRDGAEPTAQANFEVDFVNDLGPAVRISAAEIHRWSDGVDLGVAMDLDPEALRDALGGAGGVDSASGRDGYGADKTGTATVDVAPSASELLLDGVSVGTAFVAGGHHSVWNLGWLAPRKQFLVAAYDRVGTSTGIRGRSPPPRP